MHKTKPKSLALWVSLSAALCGCASSPAPLPVGQVVVAPQVTAPPVPTLVQQTPARPTGYFRRATLDALQQ